MSNPFNLHAMPEGSPRYPFELQISHDAAVEFIRNANAPELHERLVAKLGGGGVRLFFRTKRERDNTRQRARLYSHYAEERRNASKCK